jgi:hypothetical protein
VNGSRRNLLTQDGLAAPIADLRPAEQSAHGPLDIFGFHPAGEPMADHRAIHPAPRGPRRLGGDAILGDSEPLDYLPKLLNVRGVNHSVLNTNLRDSELSRRKSSVPEVSGKSTEKPTRDTWEDAAAKVGVTRGEIRAWILEHVNTITPQRWSMWNHNREPIPEKILIAFLRERVSQLETRIRSGGNVPSPGQRRAAPEANEQ